MSQDFLHLTNDQRRLVNIYLNQYAQINNQIDTLLEAQTNIRNIINSFVFNRNARSNNSRRYYNTNSRENRSVFYDYDNPVNPLSYTSPSYNQNYRNEIASLLNSFLNTSVPIYPTQRQIETATRVVRYSEIEDPVTDVCPISLERFGDDDNVRQIRHCGHIFCDNALTEWFRSNVRCPVCRYDIRNYAANNNVASNNSASSNNTSTRNNNQTDTNEEQPNSSDTNNPEAPGISNVNFIRNPTTNTVDHIEFDIENEDLANTLLTYATGLFGRGTDTSNQNTSNNSRVLYDPSYNMMLFETFLRPNRRQ